MCLKQLVIFLFFLFFFSIFTLNLRLLETDTSFPPSAKENTQTYRQPLVTSGAEARGVSVLILYTYLGHRNLTVCLCSWSCGGFALQSEMLAHSTHCTLSFCRTFCFKFHQNIFPLKLNDCDKIINHMTHKRKYTTVSSSLQFVQNTAVLYAVLFDVFFHSFIKNKIIISSQKPHRKLYSLIVVSVIAPCSQHFLCPGKVEENSHLMNELNIISSSNICKADFFFFFFSDPVLFTIVFTSLQSSQSADITDCRSVEQCDTIGRTVYHIPHIQASSSTGRL